MRVLKHAGARAFEAIVYIPKWPSFLKHPQSIVISASRPNGAFFPLGVLRGIGPGLHRLRLPLPAAAAGNDAWLHVRLRSAVSVTPEREVVDSTDKRVLGFLLITIGFR
jgi:hypothetical protein